MERGMSEFDLIDRLKGMSKPEPPVATGIGDDASVTVHDGPTATSVDAVVEGVHFSRDWSTPDQIAEKAVGTALSDIAAMAAEPGEAYVTLGIPAGTPQPFLEQLADGFARAASGFGAALTGGDTVASPVMFIAVTAVGRAPAGEQLILRSGARAGDLVAVTGELGGAAAGLALLERPELADGAGVGPETREALVQRQLAPCPRLAEGPALRGSGVSALIDVSDGLAADLGHIARSSGVAIEIDGSRIPVQAGVAEVAEATGRSLFDLVLGGGEDYELAFTLPPAALQTVEDRLAPHGCRLGVVGEVRSGSGVAVISDGGRVEPPAGFDHFA
jgi:thiamine-monophosphate kinase